MRSTWTPPQLPKAAYQAVLFDLDGVLTPTADVHMAAWRDMFTAFFDAHGVTPAYADQDYFDFVDGKPRYDGVKACLASRGIELPWGDASDAPGMDTICALGNAKNEAFNHIVAFQGVSPYPGSVALLDHLKALGVAVAVVSSSRNAPQVLAAAKIDHYFEVVVDGAVAIERGLPGKPAPDTYLDAARQLGVEAKDAVVVEDAKSGVEAGVAGNFGLVLGVDRGAGAEELREAGAHLLVNDLSEVLS